METKKRTKKQNPILFRSWAGDFYGLGIFCKKVNIIDHAVKNVLKLREDCDERRIFYKGVKIADECPMSDIAFEVSQLRELTEPDFDQFIYRRAGAEVLEELLEAVGAAHDWETPKMRAGGRAIILGMAGTSKALPEVEA